MRQKLLEQVYRISSWYQGDLRALALMRIGIALVVLVDLFIRGSDLSAHYTNQGVWPSHLIHTFGWQNGFWTIHNLYDSYTWVIFLFSLHALAAILLLLGYKTRFVTIVVWLLTISLHNRNLFILQSGDDLLRLVLLWGFFLPWHHLYSLDAKTIAFPNNKTSLAYPGYLLLLASVYFFSACLKSSDEWHAEGSAIYYALSLEQMRLSPFGDWLYQFPGLMKILTHLVLYTEYSIPVLILIPSKTGLMRGIAFLLILIIQLGFGITLYVGLFFIIGIVSAIGLLPVSILDRFESFLNINQHQHLMSNTSFSFLRAWREAICLGIIVISTIINLSGIKSFAYELTPEMMYPANILRLNQYWGMFSPYVMKKDGWFVYYGIDSIGRQWDLRRNEDYVDFKKPEHIVKQYDSDRWRKLAENMQDDRYTFLRPLFCKYILQNWNKKHPEKKIMTLDLYFMEKRSLPNYKSTPIEKKLFSVCIHD